MPIYINNEDAHNKFWQYDVNGDTVTIKWGRIGSTPQESTMKFNQSHIDKKVREKLKKGYKLQDEDTLKKESIIANSLGFQNKISTIKWVKYDFNDNSMVELGQYNPEHWVYAEVLNSWTKKVTYLLLNKHETFSLDRGNNTAVESADQIESMVNHVQNNRFIKARRLNYSSFANAVRESIKDMAAQVNIVVSKFCSIGARKLFDDCGTPNAVNIETAVSDISTQVNTSGFEKKAIVKFMSLGSRSLDL